MAEITWKNVSAPNQSAAMYGVRQGNETIQEALGGLNKGIGAMVDASFSDDRNAISAEENTINAERANDLELLNLKKAKDAAVGKKDKATLEFLDGENKRYLNKSLSSIGSKFQKDKDRAKDIFTGISALPTVQFMDGQTGKVTWKSENDLVKELMNSATDRNGDGSPFTEEQARAQVRRTMEADKLKINSARNELSTLWDENTAKEQLKGTLVKAGMDITKEKEYEDSILPRDGLTPKAERILTLQAEQQAMEREQRARNNEELLREKKVYIDNERDQHAKFIRETPDELSAVGKFIKDSGIDPNDWADMKITNTDTYIKNNVIATVKKLKEANIDIDPYDVYSALKTYETSDQGIYDLKEFHGDLSKGKFKDVLLNARNVNKSNRSGESLNRTKSELEQDYFNFKARQDSDMVATMSSLAGQSGDFNAKAMRKLTLGK